MFFLRTQNRTQSHGIQGLTVFTSEQLKQSEEHQLHPREELRRARAHGHTHTHTLLRDLALGRKLNWATRASILRAPLNTGQDLRLVLCAAKSAGVNAPLAERATDDPSIGNHLNTRGDYLGCAVLCYFHLSASSTMYKCTCGPELHPRLDI